MTITINNQKLTINGLEFHPGSRGYRNSLGVPEEPDEPDEWEWDSVVDEDGDEIDLSDKQIEQIHEALKREARESCRQ